MSDYTILHTVMDADKLARTIKRISSEIIEDHKADDELLVIGLKTRGEFLAKRIFTHLSEAGDMKLDFGVLDATLYRDDFWRDRPYLFAKVHCISADSKYWNVCQYSKPLTLLHGSR